MYGSTEEQVIACDLITVFSMGQILSHSLNQNDWISNLDSLIKFSFFFVGESATLFSLCEFDYKLEFSHSEASLNPDDC